MDKKLPNTWKDWIKRQWSHLCSLYYFTRIKDKYAGKPGFVIGNGPSLKIADLSQLEGKFVSIASNKIYLAFDQTSWRPDFYTIVDTVVAKKICDEAPKFFKMIHCQKGFVPLFRRCRTVCWRYFKTSTELPGDQPAFSTDLRVGIQGGYSVTMENLQLAVHLGLKPIYLIGCDHYYAGENDVKNLQQVEVAEGAKNYFVSNYQKSGEKVNPAMIKEMTICYSHAARWAEMNDWPIYNATRGGHLEVFPRVDLDEVLDAAKGLV